MSNFYGGTHTHNHNYAPQAMDQILKLVESHQETIIRLEKQLLELTETVYQLRTVEEHEKVHEEVHEDDPEEEEPEEFDEYVPEVNAPDPDTDHLYYEEISNQRIALRKKGAHKDEYRKLNDMKAALDREQYQLDEYPDDIFDDIV